jgi:hypothetical protein
VVTVFGWSGGKRLVEDSYTDAKAKVAEQKAEHAKKKAAKRAEREESGGRLLRRGSDSAAGEDASSSTPNEGERDA